MKTIPNILEGKKIKNFCACLVLTLMIPAFFGGQFAGNENGNIKIKELLKPKTTLAIKKKAENKDLMKDAIAILP